MVTEKRRRTDLSVPSWMKTEWEKGTVEKDQMAETLQAVNWNKAWLPFLSISPENHKCFPISDPLHLTLPVPFCR